MKLAVCIIYFNPEEKVKEMLKIYSTLFSEVLIFDNSPLPKKNIKHMISEFKNVKYVVNNRNCGMTQALSFGFKWAINNEIEYLLTMDQDSVLDKKSITNMIEYIEKDTEKDVAIYSMNYAKVYKSKDGNMITDRLVQNIDDVQNVKFSMTSGSFFKVEKLPLLQDIQDLFIGFVDQDICYTMLENNLKIKRIGSAYFHQEIGNPVKDNYFNKLFQVVNLSNVRYYYMFRNVNYLQKKYPRYKLDFLKYKLRLVFNIIVGEPQKINKVKSSLKGYKDFKKGILGEYEQR